jgi:hypothetical protein
MSVQYNKNLIAANNDYCRQFTKFKFALLIFSRRTIIIKAAGIKISALNFDMCDEKKKAKDS